MKTRTLVVTCLAAVQLSAGTAFAQITADAPAVRPDAIVNLATDEGAALVRGQWRYRDARIIEVEHRSPGPDLRPSGPPNRTYDITPHAGGAEFDDAA
jgi:gluconolactonase